MLLKWILSFLILFAINLPILANTCANISIQQKPIIFDQERIRLTQEYRRKHYGIDSSRISIIPKMIVLHWTNSKSLQVSYDYFNSDKLIENQPNLVKAGLLNVSAHFLVGRDGTIYQLMPLNWMARHIIGLNNIAIAIENVGGEKDKDDLTEQQMLANVQLVCFLKQRFPSIQYLIGHYEYPKFRGTTLWQEKDNTYQNVKQDPGPSFMQKVRGRLKAMGIRLKGP